MRLSEDTQNKIFKFCTFVLLGMFFAFAGWLQETIYCSVKAGEFVERGFLHLPFCPIYGFTMHNLYLKKGDVLSVVFETTDGKFTMEIKDPDGEVFYSGNGKDVTEFTLNVKKDGKHVVYIQAEKAKGKIDIKKS